MIIAEKALSQEHWKIFVKAIFGNHCHVQTRRQGNSASARDYCSKNSGEPGDRVAGTQPFEYGEFRDTEMVSGGQGERSDVTELRKWMKENPEATFQKAQDSFMGNGGIQQRQDRSGSKSVLRRIIPQKLATRDLEYCLPFSYSRGQDDPRDRLRIWKQWQELAFVATLNFTWFCIFDAWQAGRHLVRLQECMPEFYRCPRCNYRYPHVCGYHWTRQSYFSLAGCGTFKGVSADHQQVCQCYSTPSAFAHTDNDESTRATRRLRQGSRSYP